MKSFRQRPLTWLFWIATACLDVAALATTHEATLPNAIALGQLFVASGWLIIGRAHRLVRAGIFVATLWALTLPDFIVPRLRGGHYADLVWPHVSATYIAMAVATAAWTWCWLAMARVTSWRLPPSPRFAWQFPLAEIFGWMIIVAVGSVGVRLADFSLLNEGIKEFALDLALTAVAGGILALGAGCYGRGPRSQNILFAVILVVFLANLASGLPSDALRVATGALAFIGVWVVVLRLDERRTSTQAGDKA